MEDALRGQVAVAPLTNRGCPGSAFLQSGDFIFIYAGQIASVQRMAFPLPDKPSIAVLPFVNMTNDPRQEAFCDGLSEDIITTLSKVPKLFVIARNSVFTYKGKPVKVGKVAEELGVQYVLEGSVQRTGEQVRKPPTE